MGKLVWTDEAFESLEEVYAYLVRHSGSAAKRTVQEIYGRTELLQQFPNLGYRIGERDGVERRVLLFGHYRILYGVDGDRIAVMGIFHAARDIDLSSS